MHYERHSKNTKNSPLQIDKSVPNFGTFSILVYATMLYVVIGFRLVCQIWLIIYEIILALSKGKDDLNEAITKICRAVSIGA